MSKDNYPKKDARQRSKYQYGGSTDHEVSKGSGDYSALEDYTGPTSSKQLGKYSHMSGSGEGSYQDMRGQYLKYKDMKKAANKRVDKYRDMNRSMSDKIGLRRFKKGGKVKK